MPKQSLRSPVHRIWLLQK